jgi:hypothetical protein
MKLFTQPIKFCQICVRDIDRFPFQCRNKLPENGERNLWLNPIRRNQKCWIVLKWNSLSASWWTCFNWFWRSSTLSKTCCWSRNCWCSMQLWGLFTERWRC